MSAEASRRPNIQDLANAPDPCPPELAEAAAFSLEDRRRSPRRRSLTGAVLIHSQGRESTACIVRNLSRDGASVRLSEPIELKAPLYLLDHVHGFGFSARVVWRRETILGLKFDSHFSLPTRPRTHFTLSEDGQTGEAD